MTDTGGVRVNQTVHQIVKEDVVIGPVVTATAVVITTGGRRVIVDVHNTVTEVCAIKTMDIVAIAVYRESTEVDVSPPVALPVVLDIVTDLTVHVPDVVTDILVRFAETPVV
jgi:hypothetical protein